jgi:hypothetical protein
MERPAPAEVNLLYLTAIASTVVEQCLVDGARDIQGESREPVRRQPLNSCAESPMEESTRGMSDLDPNMGMSDVEKR